jgi:AraC-like DNA-binding protein
MSQHAPTIQFRSQLIGPALAYVRRSGGDPQGLISSLGLPSTAESDAEVILPLHRLHAFWSAAERATGDHLFGAHLGACVPQGNYGLLEYVCRTAATLRDAFGCVAQHAAMLNEVVDITMEALGECVDFKHAIVGEPLCLGRHGNECMVSMLLSFASTLTQTDVRPNRIWFAHPEPAVRGLLEAELGTRALDFGAEANGFVLTDQTLRQPLVTADQTLHAILVAQAEQLTAYRAGQTRFLGRVRQSIRDQLRDGLPTLGATARELHTSPRWLQRRLARDGTTFNRILDSVREDLARERVRAHGVSVADVAFELRYSDHSTFVRAFRRWTGTTPGKYREAS